MSAADADKSASSASALAGGELHEEWSARYRVDENEPIFEQAFDRIVAAFDAPAGATILDAGCGTANHSIRLARRGFEVQGVDFSEHALEEAHRNVAREGLSDRVRLTRGDMLALPFADAEFRYALCWGVLLHVPEIERAIAELSRVVAPGGKLAVSDTNVRSLQTLALRAVRALRRSDDDIKVTPAGVEKWRATSEGELVTRQTDVGWLIRQFNAEGWALRERWAGQLTDVYTRIGSAPVRRAIHRANGIWFTRVRSAKPAVGNILVFERS